MPTQRPCHFDQTVVAGRANGLAGFTPDLVRSACASPDRVDALVWAVTDLLVEQMSNQGIYELYRQEAEKLEAEKRAKRASQMPQVTYAPGSGEYEVQQRLLQEGKTSP